MHKSMLEEPCQRVNDSLRYRNSWSRIVVELQHSARTPRSRSATLRSRWHKIAR